MLHRQCDRATVKGNTVRDSGDAGIALYESSECDVYDNTFEDNGREWLSVLHKVDVAVAWGHRMVVTSVLTEVSRASGNYPFGVGDFNAAA